VSLRARLGPLLGGRAFWLVCLTNAGLTAVRETFNYWTPQYLVKGVGLDPGVAGLLSFVFPAAGAVSAVGAGWAADRLGGRFGRVIVPSLVVAVAALVAFAAADLRGEPGLALGLIAAVALGLMGPYTFCSGALALKLGGRRAAAAATGLIDAAGYLVGAIVSGELAGHLVKQAGFAPLLDVLVGVAVLTLLAAVLYWWHEERSDPR
jgi:OPA family glycerol-3-phosphate transporter-like MFS transporter